MRGTHINDGWLDTASTEEREILDFRGEDCGPLLSLGRFRYHSATEPLADQQHDNWLVLIFALEGAQHYQLAGRQVLLGSGQILRVRPGTRYGSGPWPEQRGTVAWMILNTRAVADCGELGIRPTVAEELFQRLTDPGGPLVFPQPGLAAGLLDAVFADWHRRQSPLGRALLRHRLADILLGSALACEDGGKDRSCPAYAAARIREVLDWIADDWRNGMHIADLVVRSRMSQARFFREFKAATGMTPKDFMLRLRIGKAVAVLEREPSVTVTDIAHDLDFASSQYFATVFRRYLGVSPSAYRGRLLSGDSPPRGT